MKLLFEKTEDEQIVAYIQEGDEKKDFDYVVLLKKIMSGESATIEFDDKIDDLEKTKIVEVYRKIEDVVKKTLGDLTISE